ncbi:MAG: acyltransferase family protein [Pseudomonadota bacterium]
MLTDRRPRLRLLARSQLGEDSYHSLLLALLRGLAALQVAAAHLRNEFFPSLRSLPDPAQWYQVLAFVTGFAHQAVLLFFLISGWLVGGSLLNKFTRPQALKLYAIDRVSRLWTVLIPAFLLMLALAVASGADLGDYAPATLAGNLVGLQTVTLPQYGGNYPLWSLANESWYYLMFPLVLLYLANRHRALCAVALMLIAALLPFEITLYFAIWLLGAAFSRVRLACDALTRVALVLLLAVLSVWVRIYGSNDDLVIASFGHDVLLALVFLTLLSSTVVRPDPSLPWLAALRKLATLLSNFSFTLYVLHVPLIGVLHWLGSRLFGQETLQPDGCSELAVYLAMLAAILVFSYGFYRLSEAHTGTVRRMLKQTLLARPQPGLRAI